MAKLETVEIQTENGKRIVNKSDDDAGLFDHMKAKKEKKTTKKKAKKK